MSAVYVQMVVPPCKGSILSSSHGDRRVHLPTQASKPLPKVPSQKGHPSRSPACQSAPTLHGSTAATPQPSMQPARSLRRQTRAAAPPASATQSPARGRMQPQSATKRMSIGAGACSLACLPCRANTQRVTIAVKKATDLKGHEIGVQEVHSNHAGISNGAVQTM